MDLHAGTFECKASYRGYNDSYVAEIIVREARAYVPPPHINNTNARNVMVGDAFTMVCSVMVDFNTIVELTWKTPNPRAIADHRISQPESSYRNMSWAAGTHLKLVQQVKRSL